MTGQGLLGQISEDVLDDSVPLTSLLRKCLMLGARSGSSQLREWVGLELDGYVGAPELPKYRTISAPMEVFITNRAGYGGLTQRLQPSMLPKEIFGDVEIEVATISYGVGELEALVASGNEKNHISPYWASAVVEYLNMAHMDEVSLVNAAYWVIYPTSLQGMLAKIRNTLIALVAELVAETPPGQAMPDKATTDRAVQVLIYGNNNSVSLQHSGEGSTNTSVTATGEATTAVGSQIVEGEHATAVGNQSVRGDGNTVAGRDATTTAANEPAKDSWWTGTRKRGLAITIATLIAAFAGVATWLDWMPWKP